MIEPVSDDLTIRISPRCSANRLMMISGALPRVAFRSPPRVGPRYSARASVASPINPASGTIASAEARNTRTGLAPNQASAIAIGMKNSSQFSFISFKRRLP